MFVCGFVHVSIMPAEAGRGRGIVDSCGLPDVVLGAELQSSRRSLLSSSPVLVVYSL